MTNKILKFLLSSQDSNSFLDEAKLAAKGCEGVNGICSDYSGNIYVADAKKHAIFKVTERGSVHLFAGQVGFFGNNGSTTVKASEAKFNTPGGLTCDKSGNIYVADTGNNQIRKIDDNGKASLVAGDPDGSAGYVDNGFTTSRFNAPRDVFVDHSNNVYVADTFNHCIRLISVSKNTVLTIAGDGTSGDAIGLGSVAKFNRPSAIVGDIGGRIYIADSENFKLKTLLPNGMVYHFSGSGVFGNNIGIASNAQYQEIKFMTVEKTGSIFIIDVDPNEVNDSRLLRIDANGKSSIVNSFDDVNKKLLSGVSVTPGQTMFVTQSTSTEFNASFVEIDADETYTVDTQDETINDISFKYVGGEDNTSTVIINGESVVVGDVGGSFVFDIGGAQEHTFATPGESIVVVLGGQSITITYIGAGSHLFDVKLPRPLRVPSQYATLQDAIDAANTGDKIIIAHGNYPISEIVDVNKSVTISGFARGNSISKLTCQTADAVPMLSVTADNVVIENLHLTITQQAVQDLGGKPSDIRLEGLIRIRQGGQDNVIIRNNEIYAPSQGDRYSMSTWNGRGMQINADIGVGAITNVLIENNTIYNFRNGILGYGQGTTITYNNNLIYNTKGGIMNHDNENGYRDKVIENNAWIHPQYPELGHNEWDVVWNSDMGFPTPFPPTEDFFHERIITVSEENNGAYVCDLYRTEAGAAVNNRSHIWVDVNSSQVTPHPARGHFLEPYGTIELALDAVFEGGQVFVAPGLYKENVVITKSMTVTGPTANISKNGYVVPTNYAWDTTKEAVIQPPDDQPDSMVFDVDQVSNVTVQGIIVQALYRSGSGDRHLFRVRTNQWGNTASYENINVKNCVIGPNTNVDDQDGNKGRMNLYMSSANYGGGGSLSNSVVSGNKIFGSEGNGNAIFIWGGYSYQGDHQYDPKGRTSYDGVIIEDNEIGLTHRSAIEIAGSCDGLIIRNNYIHDNYDNGDPDYKWGQGIAIMRPGSQKATTGASEGQSAWNLQIYGNTFKNIAKFAIYMGPKVKNITINNNIIEGNGYAIQVDFEELYHNGALPVYDFVENVIASNNRIVNNDMGVGVQGEVPQDSDSSSESDVEITFELDARHNWWGTNVESAIQAMITDRVLYIPWLTS